MTRWRRPWLAAVAIAGALPFIGAAWAGANKTGEKLPVAPTTDLAAFDQRIADSDARAESSRKELASLGEQVALRHARILARGKVFYRLTRAGLLPVGGGFGALVTYAMHVERARRVLAADIDAERRLRGQAAEVALDLERTAHDRAALTSQRGAIDAARVATEDEQRRQGAFERAFDTSTGAGTGYVAVYAENALAPNTPAGGFATARGRLVLPVAGRAEVNAVRRQGNEGPGIEFRAAGGTPVRAVFAGRIAFADRYGPHGRIVIVDHGDHYFTVSGNLDEIDVKIGQDVGGGERIGTVGDDGRGPMLYFEVRHGAHTVAPEAWLGL